MTYIKLGLGVIAFLTVLPSLLIIFFNSIIEPLYRTGAIWTNTYKLEVNQWQVKRPFFLLFVSIKLILWIQSLLVTLSDVTGLSSRVTANLGTWILAQKKQRCCHTCRVNKHIRELGSGGPAHQGVSHTSTSESWVGRSGLSGIKLPRKIHIKQALFYSYTVRLKKKKSIMASYVDVGLTRDIWKFQNWCLT